MNYHDSERMAGLLEHAGYEARRRRRGRRRHRHQHLQRARAGGRQAVHAARRTAAVAAETGPIRSWRSPAAWRSRKATALLKRSGVVDVIVGTQRVWHAADAARAGGSERRPPQIDLNPYDDVSFPFGVTRRSRSGPGVRHHHRGLQRFLQLLRRAVHPRPRADATEGGHPRRSPRRRRTAAAAKCSCSGRSSITTRRPTIPAAISPGCSRRFTRSPGVERIRFASPHPRHVTRALDRGHARPAEGLQAPPPAGAVGLDARPAAMRRRYTRESYLDLVARSARRCPASRSRPI